MSPDVRYFPDRAGLRSWFERHHATAPEVWIGFFKAHVRKAGLDYLEAVEEALCFGWIDTTVRRVDDERYAHRFTRRRDGSRWSDANRLRFEELRKTGRVAPSGQRAYDRREPDDPRRYSYERGGTPLSPPFLARLRAVPTAWRFFQDQAPSYRGLAAHWVMSAVRPETRDRRFRELLDASARRTRPRAFLVAREARARAGSASRPVARGRRNRATHRRREGRTESR